MLPPGQLHAVVSPVNSAITAWLCHKDDWEKDIDELMIGRRGVGGEGSDKTCRFSRLPNARLGLY